MYFDVYILCMMLVLWYDHYFVCYASVLKISIIFLLKITGMLQFWWKIWCCKVIGSVRDMMNYYWKFHMYSNKIPWNFKNTFQHLTQCFKVAPANLSIDLEGFLIDQLLKLNNQWSIWQFNPLIWINRASICIFQSIDPVIELIDLTS